MQADDTRIKALEDEANSAQPTSYLYLAVRVLCEIARQLSRLADSYEETHK